MNEIKNWTFDGSEVRTVEVNGEPYFVGKQTPKREWGGLTYGK